MTTAPGTEEKLYANKFKTVEELEAGYKNSLPVFQENQDLKKKFEDATKVPDDYMTPLDTAFQDHEIAELKRIAKDTGVTQSQFEKMAKTTHATKQAQAQAYETAKKELGADNINIIQDFVKKQYGEKIGDTLLKSAIVNKEVREEILAQRSSALNTSAPGISRPYGGGYSVTHKDVMAAREEMLSSRGNAQVKARERYLNLQSAIAHQKT